MTASIALDPTLDPASMRATFNRFGRIHIPAFLTPDAASAVHQALAGETGWMCTTRGGGKVADVPIEQVEAFTAEQTATFTTLAHAEAAEGFHFLYDTVRISDGDRMYEGVNPILTGVIDFMNGPAFRGFIRTLTGDARPAFVDGQATRYRPGQYLTEHDDDMPDAGRLYAYVLNLTPRWRTDWGGVLNFIDDDGHVAEGYRPSWNALNLFRVPQTHAVGHVAPFAQAPRLSITGWVRGG